MRQTLVLLLLASSACASAAGPGGRTTSAAPERRTTTVTYTRPDGAPVNVTLESSTMLETKSFPIAAAAEAIWRSLPLAYQDLGIPLAAHDTVQHYMGNPGLAINNGRLGTERLSSYLNCGSDAMTGPLADRYAVRLSVVSRVRRDGEGGVLETQVSGEAARRGVASNPVVCSSTGQLEEAIANATKLRLAGGHPR